MGAMGSSNDLFSKLMRLAMAVVLACGCMLGGCTPPMAESNDISSPDAAVVAELSDSSDAAADIDVTAIVSGMTLDEKVSQMIVPSFRTWEDVGVVDLAAVPGLAETLRRHQYGGVALYTPNVSGTAQVARLVCALQANNAEIPASTHVPYLVCVDEEGGIVTRLSNATRMTGSMAIGATGAEAESNARRTGQIIGEELAALGICVDFAPSIDVNSNAANPVIGTRSFSDDPAVVSKLGVAFGEGLTENGVIATYKHYPGHGDTGEDSHISIPSVGKSLDELKQVELSPFQYAIDQGADLVMTAHITYPGIDEQVAFADGATNGWYPATMSRKMIDGVLRGDMGYDGVVMTDALEMSALYEHALVPGDSSSPEYGANIAEHAINAGVDILLIPADLGGSDMADWYDRYITAIQDKVSIGAISVDRIDESVTRVLELKRKHGVFGVDASAADIESAAAKAEEVVGSQAHHDAERDIARQAITLVKNEGQTLPFALGAGRPENAGGKGGSADAASVAGSAGSLGVTHTTRVSNVVLVEEYAEDCVTLAYAVKNLQDQGVIGRDVVVRNLVDGTATGPEAAAADASTVTVGSYLASDADGEDVVSFSDGLEAAIGGADAVVAVSANWGLASLQDGAASHQGIRALIDGAHATGATFTLLSANLPYDCARYPDADAILLAYMGEGADVDPVALADGQPNPGAYNANIIAAVEVLFGAFSPTGTLPVNIPDVVVGDGAVSYSADILYQRGFGLAFE